LKLHERDIMNFLDIGGMEIVVLLLVALLILGPGRIVEIGRTLGRFSRRVSRTGKDFARMLQDEYDPSSEEQRSHSPPEKQEQKQV
jgi:Sec-independent protein translocase protein TatA